MKKKCLPNTWFQFYSGISASVAMLICGLCYGWPSPSIPKLLDGSHVKTTDDDASWLAVMTLLASIPGALIASVVLNKVGPRRVIVFLGIPYFVSWMLIAFANGVEMLYIARILDGICDGIVYTVIPMYIGEIAGANVRGLLGSLQTVCQILGVTIINGLGQYSSIYTTALMAAGLSLVYTCLVFFITESPYYHIQNDQYEEAKQSLRKLRGVDDVDDEFVRLTMAIQEDQNNEGRFWDLFTVSSNRKTLLVIFGLRTVQQFSGIVPITFYTPEILTMEHIVVIYFVVQLFMTFVSSLIVDRAGRRPLLLLSSIGTGLASTCAGVYFYLLDKTTVDVSNLEFVPVIAMIAYIVLHGVGLSTIPLMMNGEVFSTSVKSFGIPVVNIYFCICATAVTQFFYLIRNAIGMYVAFACFAFFSFSGSVFIYSYVPETKGKTLEEIVEHFKSGGSVRRPNMA